jgi:hypothetical protein
MNISFSKVKHSLCERSVSLSKESSRLDHLTGGYGVIIADYGGKDKQITDSS